MDTIAQPRIVIDGQLRHDTVLWRYLDAARLFDFFENSTLFFCRADRFSDKFEGAFTPTLRQQISDAYARGEIDYTYEQFKRRMRESVFINCWHRSQDDSAAMWALYGKSECAVALTTTVGQLADTLEGTQDAHEEDHAIRIARVDYVKHWSDPKLDISPDYVRIFTYKTKAYEYEKEVRVIIDRTGRTLAPALLQSGILVTIDAATLVRSIVIAPDAPPWFEKLVRQSALRYGIEAPVRRSKLATDPI